MPKDATKNVDRYKIRGGHLNEFDFHQNQAELAETRTAPSDLIPGTPPEAKARAVQELAKRAQQRGMKKAANASAAKPSGTKKRAAAKTPTKRTGTKKSSKRAAAKTSTRQTGAKKTVKGATAKKLAAKKAAKKK